MRSSNPLPGKSRETGTPSEHAFFRHPLDRPRGIARNLDREFVEKRLVQNLDASHRREPVREGDSIGVIDPG